MSHLYLIVQDVLQSGYLSLEAEGQLKNLSAGRGTTTALDDEETLMFLKQAIAFGHVRRQSTELKLQAA